MNDLAAALLADQPGPDIPSFRTGTVTGTNPLRVHLDGDAAPSPGTPLNFSGTALGVGRRVHVMIYQRRMTVVGASAAAEAPTAIHRAKMTKTSSGPTYAATTWTQVAGFTSTDFATGITADAAAGTLTIQEPGYYDVVFHQRWQNYVNAHRRQGAICIGTSAPAADASNVIGGNASQHNGWYAYTLHVPDVLLGAGDVLTFWVYSGAGSTFNSSSAGPVPAPSFVSARRAAT